MHLPSLPCPALPHSRLWPKLLLRRSSQKVGGSKDFQDPKTFAVKMILAAKVSADCGKTSAAKTISNGGWIYIYRSTRIYCLPQDGIKTFSRLMENCSLSIFFNPCLSQTASMRKLCDSCCDNF